MNQNLHRCYESDAKSEMEKKYQNLAKIPNCQIITDLRVRQVKNMKILNQLFYNPKNENNSIRSRIC